MTTHPSAIPDITQVSAPESDARFRELIDNGTTYLNSDRVRAAECAREALTIAEGTASPQDTVEALCLLGDALKGTGDYEEAIAALVRAGAIVDADPCLAGLRAAQLRRLAITYHGSGDYDTSRETFERALAIVGSDRWERARLLTGLGGLLRGTGEYARAFELITEALEIWTDMGYLNGIGLANSYLGTLHLSLEEWDMAIEYFERSLAINREIGNLAGEATVLSNLGGACMERGDLETGISHQLQAVELNRKLGNRHNVGIGLSGIAIAYGRIGETEQARSYHRSALEVQRAIGEPGAIAHTLFCLAEIELEYGTVRCATDLVREARALISDITNRSAVWFAHKMSARIAEIEGNTAEALREYKSYMEAREEIQGQELRRKVTQLQVRTEVLRAEKDRELFRVQAERLEREMELKNEQLAQQALHVARLSQFANDLRSDLTPYVSSDLRQAREIAHKILDRLDAGGPTASWQTFEEQFNGSHPEFFASLAREYPSLSRTELKVCALLRIKLSTKEIADVLSTSVRTIDNHRRHIRQKMNLANEISLSTHLATF